MFVSVNIVMGKSMTDHDESREPFSEAVRANLTRRAILNRILGKSPAVIDLQNRILNIADTDVSVLITGESGTGKELAARTIHYLSRRASMPFVPVNCGAIPENLFENELFGHMKGAFTDARQFQEGLVREAEGGALFLDEIGVMRPSVQVKLLRLIQEKEYKPLGSSRCYKANIRIIAATNEHLSVLVKKGEFREDLFYRLNILSLNIPPLRERKEDIPILAESFIRKYSEQYGKPIQPLPDEVMEKLSAHNWPGNIRELENKIQQALVMDNRPEMDFSVFQSPSGRFDLQTDALDTLSKMKKDIVENFEKEYLEKLLKHAGGDMVIAASLAGKSRTALWNLLSRYNLHPGKFSRKT